jgi:hypothetical protein
MNLRAGSTSAVLALRAKWVSFPQIKGEQTVHIPGGAATSCSSGGPNKYAKCWIFKQCLWSKHLSSFNFYSNNLDTADTCGHGTAVAGVAAAAINNGTGVAGVSGQSKVMPIRVAYFDPTRNGCYAYYSTIVSGLTYAADHGARVANVSYGGLAASSTVQSATQYMKGKGGLVFVSAGNDGVNANVASTTTMIPVSATDSNDSIASWSPAHAVVSGRRAQSDLHWRTGHRQDTSGHRPGC